MQDELIILSADLKTIQVGKVLWSRITLEKLMKLIENEKEIYLTIKNTWEHD